MDPAKELLKRIKSKGYQAVHDFVHKKVPENTWLDYKLTVNPKTGVENWDSIRIYYSKAVSGFGNSDGGLLIWGVDCPKEIPKSIINVQDAVNLAARLNDEQSFTTNPSHALVQNLAFTEDDNSTAGVVVTYVPVAPNRPLQARRAKEADFFIRAGESFGSAPYNVLAGMFGRQPSPEIRARVELATSFGNLGGAQLGTGTVKLRSSDSNIEFLGLWIKLFIENISSIAARESYVSAKITGLRKEFVLHEAPAYEGRWAYRKTSFGIKNPGITVMARQDFLLAPNEESDASEMTLLFPVDKDNQDRILGKDLHIKIVAGAKGAVPHLIDIEMTANEIEKIGYVMRGGGLIQLPFDEPTYQRILTSNF